MRVEALDHVNIITDKLQETADFYAEILNLERRDAPPPLTPSNAVWMHDDAGRAIVHINSEDCPRAFDRSIVPGALTGALHHVALRCTDYADTLQRLNARGASYQENTVSAIGLRQIFTADPNNVLLELNFFGD